MEKQHKGVLYVVATPIGHLEDITLRALKILNEVDYIVCEDTRVTLKLLNKYGIKKKLISYYQPKELARLPFILQLLREGKMIALVSDSGTPGISDPGYHLIKAAIEENFQIIPIPGVSALTASLCASGLPLNRVLFLGFPAYRKGKLKRLLESLKEEPGTMVFYLSTRKLISFLEITLEILGNRRAVIARELSKVHEEFIRGRIEEIINNLKGREIKGEATLLIEGRTE